MQSLVTEVKDDKKQIKPLKIQICAEKTPTFWIVAVGREPPALSYMLIANRTCILFMMPVTQAAAFYTRVLFSIPSMSSGGCSFPSSTHAHLPSLNLSIKSEHSSPEHMSSPTSPPLRHLGQHSPKSQPHSARRSSAEAGAANEAKEFPKAGYLHEEDKGQRLRELEISDGWQR